MKKSICEILSVLAILILSGCHNNSVNRLTGGPTPAPATGVPTTDVTGKSYSGDLDGTIADAMGNASPMHTSIHLTVNDNSAEITGTVPANTQKIEGHGMIYRLDRGLIYADFAQLKLIAADGSSQLVPAQIEIDGSQAKMKWNTSDGKKASLEGNVQ